MLTPREGSSFGWGRVKRIYLSMGPPVSKTESNRSMMGGIKTHLADKAQPSMVICKNRDDKKNKKVQAVIQTFGKKKTEGTRAWGAF